MNSAGAWVGGAGVRRTRDGAYGLGELDCQVIVAEKAFSSCHYYISS